MKLQKAGAIVDSKSRFPSKLTIHNCILHIPYISSIVHTPYYYHIPYPYSIFHIPYSIPAGRAAFAHNTRPRI